VLVVEDDPAQREEFRSVLERQGYAVALAASPAEAFTWLKASQTPDLILLDMMHPKSREGDGWHFLHRRQQFPELRAIPVMIVTALGTASPEWAESLGAVGLLRKPVDGERVAAEVRRYLEGRPKPASGLRQAARPMAPPDATPRTNPGTKSVAAAGLARVLLGRLLRQPQ
jgi:CheY-like chemotaxis protein